jgi:hypothetical protein
MPAPGPGGSWIDAFQGNKRNDKWQSNRISDGGQNTGVWYSQVKNDKLYWKGQTINTESSWWGENISLAVNAPGDIIIEAEVRLKRVTGLNARTGIGFNQGATTSGLRYGTAIHWEALMYLLGVNVGGATPWPGRPSQSYLTPGTSDQIALMRVIRKNGYAFLYTNGYYVGSYVFAPTITTVNIVNVLHNGAQDIDIERWIHWVRVWPREVVL